MAKGHCQQGCYPVDKKWHGGSMRVTSGNVEDVTKAGDPENPATSMDELSDRLGKQVYKGKGDFVIEDIFDFRRFVNEFGPEAGEELMRETTPNGEPYVRGAVTDDSEPIRDKIRKRNVSLSTTGQGEEMGAFIGMMDWLSTHYKYGPVIKTLDVVNYTPQSQVWEEMTQRRQTAEQQINRTLQSLGDLYEQKQLLEHDKRKLEARLEHVEQAEEYEAERGKGKSRKDEDVERDTQDELKADFVDLVDQHTGRHSILQMQSNNVFPSITADFYSMTRLEDLETGHLKDLPENEKAVLRKKWKLYQRWKDQFQAAVRSRYNDVQRRLNSVETSIEQTEQWIKPYVQDIKRITGDFDEQLAQTIGLSKYLPVGYANVNRKMKVIAAKDQSPGQESDQFYDVVLIHATQGSLPSFENPQAAGQGLTIMSVNWEEFLVCKHVYEAVFAAQIEEKSNEVKEYIDKFVGREGVTASQDEIAEKKAELKDRFVRGGDKIKGMKSFKLGKSERERIEEADTMDELERIEEELEWKYQKPGWFGRKWGNFLNYFGHTDEFYYRDPTELRRNLVGPGFPTRLYLDYKYNNDMHVMK